MTIIAFIPARSKSKRIADKNIRQFKGHPLLAYAISSAIDSGIFQGVYVSTDSQEYADIARYYGADVIIRPAEYALDTSPDAEWIGHALGEVPLRDSFAILRPTSPFRTKETIKRAWEQFKMAPQFPLKAVERVSQHPCKMWQTINAPTIILAIPLLWHMGHTESHLLPSQLLPTYYVQNACIEIRKVGNATTLTAIEPFATEGYEGIDINEERDLVYADWLIEHGKATLPEIRREPWKFEN